MTLARVLSELASEKNQSGRSSASRQQGGMIGVVVDNKDPEDRYRVRVSFPWLSDQYTKDTTSDGSDSKVQSFWARIASPLASNDYGAFLLPEIDDEVIVIFEDGDFSRPIVVGCLWNGTNKVIEKVKVSPDDTETQISNNNQGGKNDFRMFRSRCGNQITFQDKEGEGAISLRSAKSAELCLDDKDGSERIRLYDKDHTQWLEIDTANKSITLETDTGDILIKAKNKITVDCKDLEVTVGNSTTVNSKTSIKVDTKDMESKASNTYKIEGSSSVTIKGGKIDLNP